MKKLAQYFSSKEGARYIAETGDIPSWIRWNGQKWPIGRYLKSVLRAELGFHHTSTPSGVIASVAGRQAALKDGAEARERLESVRLQSEHEMRTKARLMREKEKL